MSAATNREIPGQGHEHSKTWKWSPYGAPARNWTDRHAKIAPMPKLPRTVNLPVPASPTRHEILEGLRITAPVAAGYIPLGLAYGVLVIQLGLRHCPWPPTRGRPSCSS